MQGIDTVKSVDMEDALVGMDKGRRIMKFFTGKEEA
jgi:hypothetical protein